MLLFSEIFILFCIKKEVFEQHKETERPEKRTEKTLWNGMDQRESGQSVHSLELLHPHENGIPLFVRENGVSRLSERSESYYVHVR